jgi:hypothetical protein
MVLSQVTSRNGYGFSKASNGSPVVQRRGVAGCYSHPRCAIVTTRQAAFRRRRRERRHYEIHAAFVAANRNRKGMIAQAEAGEQAEEGYQSPCSDAPALCVCHPVLGGWYDQFDRDNR